MLEHNVGFALALLLHELATNATKHGALSNPIGTVRIRWGQESSERACLEWKERLGPPVMQPSRTGSGSRLFISAFQQGKGEAKLAFEPDGIRCTIRFASQQLGAAEVSGRVAAGESAEAYADTGEQPATGQTITGDHEGSYQANSSAPACVMQRC
jgi:hypothetical protein